MRLVGHERFARQLDGQTTPAEFCSSYFGPPVKPEYLQSASLGQGLTANRFASVSSRGRCQSKKLHTNLDGLWIIWFGFKHYGW